MQESAQTHALTATLRTRIREIAERTESLRLSILFLLVAGIALILLCVTAFDFYRSPHNHPMQAAVVAIGLVPSFFLYSFLNSMYQRKAKTYLMAKVSETLSFTYKAEGAFAIKDVAGHKILPPAAEGSIEDGFTGTYRDIGIELEEVQLRHLQQLPGVNDPRREMRSFWGLVVRLRLRKKLGAHTVVVPAAAMHAFFAKEFAAYKPIKLAAEPFEKNYLALSTDSVEAKLTLTTAFIERFMEAGKFMSAKWGAASFAEDEILFALQRFRPLFEVAPLWKPVTQISLHRSVEELDTVLRLVDTLKANGQLGI